MVFAAKDAYSKKKLLMNEKYKTEMKIIGSIAVFVFWGLSGCAAFVNYIPAGQHGNIVSSEKIEILTESPAKAYEVLGLLEATGNSRDKIILALKEKAAELGADALMEIVMENKKIPAAEKSKGAYASSGIMWEVPKTKINLFGSLVGRAKVIRYTSE